MRARTACLGLRQHVVALLPQARRHAYCYRRALCGAVRSEAWAGTYGAVARHPAGGCAEHAKLNVIWGNNATVTNLHLVRSVRRGEAQGRPARGDRSAAHQDRRAGRSALGAAARHRRVARLRARRPSSSGSARIDEAFIAANVLGYRRVHGAARASGRRSAPPRPAACRRRQIRHAAPTGWPRPSRWCMAPGNGLERGRNGGSGIRAAIALAGADGQARQQAAASCSAPATPFRRRSAKLQRPDLAPPGTRTLNHHRRRSASGRATTSIRRCARCSSTTTTRSSCIPTRTGCSAASRARTSSRSASRSP